MSALITRDVQRWWARSLLPLQAAGFASAQCPVACLQHWCFARTWRVQLPERQRLPVRGRQLLRKALLVRQLHLIRGVLAVCEVAKVKIRMSSVRAVWKLGDGNVKFSVDKLDNLKRRNEHSKMYLASPSTHHSTRPSTYTHSPVRAWHSYTVTQASTSRHLRIARTCSPLRALRSSRCGLT